MIQLEVVDLGVFCSSNNSLNQRAEAQFIRDHQLNYSPSIDTETQRNKHDDDDREEVDHY